MATNDGNEKRRRLNDPPPSLPASLWAHVLNFACFDEVLSLTSCCHFLLKDVPPQLKYLLVRTGRSMDVMPAAARRFSSVDDVNIYSLLEELPQNPAVEGHNSDSDSNDEAHAQYHLDSVTVETAIPFLKNLPQLKQCSFGGLSRDEKKMSWSQDDIRGANDLEYDVWDSSLYDTPNSRHKMAQLIETACRSYSNEDFLSSHEVKFFGLIPYQVSSPVRDRSPCAWRCIPKTEWYRDDVYCQICDMICNSLPCLQVMNLDCSYTPCIKFSNRLKISRFRDPRQYESNATKLLLYHIEGMGGVGVMCPPDFTEMRYATKYEESDYEKMRFWISEGGNVRDPRVREILVQRKEDEVDEYYEYFFKNKRVVHVETYNRLKEIGVDINEQDFLMDYKRFTHKIDGSIKLLDEEIEIQK